MPRDFSNVVVLPNRVSFRRWNKSADEHEAFLANRAAYAGHKPRVVVDNSDKPRKPARAPSGRGRPPEAA